MPLNHLTAFNLVKTISASTLTGSPLPYRLSSLGHPVNLRVLYSTVNGDPTTEIAGTSSTKTCSMVDRAFSRSASSLPHHLPRSSVLCNPW